MRSRIPRQNANRALLQHADAFTLLLASPAKLARVHSILIAIWKLLAQNASQTRRSKTVVGKPAAAVMISSPGLIARSLWRGEVRALKAMRLAEDLELTVSANMAPRYLPVSSQSNRCDSPTSRAVFG